MAENKRYLALDVFRGMTVCFMIIVNTPGDWSHVYAPLLHANWHGFTPTDLVFPSFLFAVGNAMAFVMHKYENKGSSEFWTKTIKRTIIIFLIGYLMSWFPFFSINEAGDHVFRPLDHTRILGVLQRIALCYLFASVIIHFLSKRIVIIFSIAALFIYWLVMWVFGDPNDPFSLVGNAALRLDVSLFGENHLYHGEGIAFDPEGLLSTLPAIANVIVGYLAGNFIRTKGNSYETTTKLFLAGALLIVGALTWHMAFPINKKLWTSSFVLLTVGLDLTILASLIYFIEINHKQKWTPFFTVFGKNPLFIYVISEVLLIVLYMIPVGEVNAQFWIAHNLLESIFNPINASLAFALLFMLACWSLGYVLDRKKIYIKV